MEFINNWRSSGEVISSEDVLLVIKLIAPLAPFMTEELWQLYRCGARESDDVGSLDGFKKELSVHWQEYPESVKYHIKDKPVVIVVEVNGRVRANLSINMSDYQLMSDKAKLVVEMAKNDNIVRKWIGEGEVVKEVWVEPKTGGQGLVNFVVKSR